MEGLCATKSEIGKLKTLALYFHHLQLKGEAEFKHHPRHWIEMDPRFGNELEYYLNSPISKISEEPFQTRPLRQKFVASHRQPCRVLNQKTT